MLVIVAAVLAFLIWLCLHIRRNYGTLEKMGIPVVPPGFLSGSEPFMIHKTNYIELDKENFRKYGLVWGSYSISQPWVSIADPDLIKEITVKSFDHFTDHFFEVAHKKFRTLDMATGEEWRDLRKALSPTFSSGKLKGMLELLEESMDKMIEYIEKNAGDNNVATIKAKNMFQLMALDVIAKCAFGIDANSFENPESNDIIKNGRDIFEGILIKSATVSTIINIIRINEKLMKVIDILPEAIQNLWNLTKKVQDQRLSSGIERGDFIDRLNELNKKVVAGEFPNLTSEQVTGQGIVFLGAGFETTSNTLTTLCLNLAKHPEVLNTLLEEVDEVIERFDGVVNHETINDMPFLDACIKENLRLNGPAARLDRKCTKDWTSPDGKLVIKRGTKIRFPYYVVHHNPDWWPEPLLYKPERFLKENAHNIKPYTWIPFGSGPRVCIGERFAMVEMKIAMAKLLQKFTPELTEESKITPNKGDFFTMSYPDFDLKFVKRQY